MFQFLHQYVWQEVIIQAAGKDDKYGHGNVPLHKGEQPFSAEFSICLSVYQMLYPR